MKVRRLGPVAALAAVALLFAAAPATARIVPYKSVAGIEPGMSEGELRDALGEPSRVEQGPVVGARVFVYKRRKLEVTVANGGVGAIVSRSRAEKMSNGLGVGTSFARIRRWLRGERCEKVRRERVCAVDRRGVTMAFLERRRRVHSVSLSSISAVPDAPRQR